MNIAIAGKGGVGKTIVSGTLARAFAANGCDVLAIDHDSDSHLARSLGVSPEEAVTPVPAELVRQVEGVEGSPSWQLTKPPSEVIREYGVRAPEGVTLLVARSVEAESGSFAMGHVAVTEILSADRERREDVAVVDMPAGLEYFGVINHVDLLLVVVEHATTALDTFRTMDLYARKELDHSKVAVIANGVRNEGDLAAIEAYCADHETPVEVAAVIPDDDAIRRAEREGAAPADAAADSEAVAAIRELADDLDPPCRG
jgi:CO dehydrogenase maturation factor